MGALVGLDQGPRDARAAVRSPATQAALLRALEPGAIALDNALRVARAEALSVTDDLTQLYNSRYLSQVLRRETKRASRSGRPLSLLFIDLDGFKAINDTHGHFYGSRALSRPPGLIRLSARETDVVSRFGGDEFALILPDTGSEGAAAVGERIRERVNAHRFLQGDGLDIHLTVSVGVATLPDVAASTEGLIQAADEAMYHVKEHGKNGIYIAGSGSEERIVESTVTVFTVLERSGDRPRDGQHLRLRARARASSSTSPRSWRSTRSTAGSKRSARTPRRCSAARPATSWRSSR